MPTRALLLPLVLAATAALLAPVRAAAPAAVAASTPESGADAGPRVLSVDVVQLVNGQEVMGREELFVDHRGFRYHFASEASKARFLGKPQLYEVQLGGACARMGPLSGPGDPRIHAVHAGRVYLFASEACRQTFLEDPESLLPRDEPPVVAEPDERAAGVRLIERAVRAHGGASALDGVATYFAEHTRQRGQDERPYTSGTAWYARFGARGVTDLALVEGWFHDDEPEGGWQRDCVSSERDDWIREDGALRPMHSSQRAELRGRFLRHPLAILRSRSRDDFVAAPAGAGQVGETVTERLRLSFAGTSTTLDLDADGLILAASWVGRGGDARLGATTRVYQDYRELGGVRLPFAWTDTFEGQSGDQRHWQDLRLDVAFLGMFER